MALRIAVEISGVRQLNRALGVVASAVKDLRPVWEDIYEDFLRRERTLFARQGNVGSPSREVGATSGVWGPWAPLNPEYAARKRAMGYGSRILVRTGRLRDSLTQRGHVDAVFSASPKSMALGTGTPYAGYHQTGTSRMPRREPLRISEAQSRAWVRMIQLFLIESGQFERENQ